MINLFYIFILLTLIILFLVFLKTIEIRKTWKHRVPAISGDSLAERTKSKFIIGTDNDLKIELAFIVYLAIIISLTNPSFHPRTPFQLLQALVAIILGFHFRQWLSKWRLLNIVSLRRLTSNALFVWKANSTLSFAINHALTWYLLYLNPYYAALQLFGVFVHEMSLETRKNTLVLRRRLHLFDLEYFAIDPEVTRVIHKVTRLRGLPRLKKLILLQQDPKKRLVLEAFHALITNDQLAFQALLLDNSIFIRSDSDLCYYFGRALYTLGDIAAAEELLQIGCQKDPDIRCAAYLALVALAPGNNPEGAQKARATLEPYIESGPESAGKMFAHAYYALASIMLADVHAKVSTPETRDALYHIHTANRINEQFLAEKSLGKLSYSYYRGNELILMDICGYIIFRLGEPRLAYRILEGAIRADNTYPWPYFHIALIYERAGKARLAQALFARIALNERTDSVIYRLSADRIQSISTSS